MRRTRRADAPAGNADEAMSGTTKATPEDSNNNTPVTSDSNSEVEQNQDNTNGQETVVKKRPASRRRTSSAKTKKDSTLNLDPGFASASTQDTSEESEKTPTAEQQPEINEPKKKSSSRSRSRTKKSKSASTSVAASDETLSEQSSESIVIAENTAVPALSGTEHLVEVIGDAEPTPVKSSKKRSRRQQSKDSDVLPTSGLPENITAVTPIQTQDVLAEKETRPVRKGRSRRRKVLSPNIEPVSQSEQSDVVEAVTPILDETETEDSRRSRRRRGGRRHRDDSFEFTESSTLLLDGEAELALEIPDDVTEESFLPFPTPPPPVYIAPPIVRPVTRTYDMPEPPISVSLDRDSISGHIKIKIDDKTLLPYFFFINAETAIDGEVVDAQIRHAASQNIHLYSSVMYLPLKNAYGERSFGPIDAVIQQILAADPDAYIMPRLQFVPTNYWVRTHHDQLAVYTDGSEGDVSLASLDFWSDCVDAIEALIVHFSDPKTPGGDRVIGFHIDRGEWFYESGSGYDISQPNRTAFQNWLHQRYQFIYELRRGWYDGTITFETADVPVWPGANSIAKKGDTPLFATLREGRWVDYNIYASDLIAQVINGLANAIKILSNNRLLVAVSYGYILEFSNRNDSGHLALHQILECDDIDIIGGPNSYNGRGPGGTGAFGAPIDSIILHKKLWLIEDDTKTYLADVETPDTYNPKIINPIDTASVHQRQFAAAYTHKTGVTWMDLWGQGWLNDGNIWNLVGKMRDLSEKWEPIFNSASQNKDVVVLVDEASLCYIKNDCGIIGSNLIGKTKELLQKTGASVRYCLQSDILHDNLPDAPLYLFLNAFRITTEERQAIREKLQRPGKTLAWLYAPGIFDENGPATEEISDVVGMTIRLQAWNSKVGSQLTDIRHPITERVRSGKRLGQEEVLNPSYSVSDPQAVILGEYVGNSAPSMAVREHQEGWKSVFFGDPHITVELLRGLFAYAGVHIYDTQDDVVYAGNEGLLLIHAPYTGQRTVHLPQRSTVYDVTDHRILVVDSKSFRTFLRARTSRMFLIGSQQEITAATGLTAPQHNQRHLPPAAPEQPVIADVSTADLRSSEVSAIVDIISEEVIDDGKPYPLIPGLDTYEIVELTEEEAAQPPPTLDDMSGSQPRSRWQRRRAAAKARRDAERKTKQDIVNERTLPPPDIASLLPDLPPRIKEVSVEQEEVQSTVLPEYTPPVRDDFFGDSYDE